MPANSDNGEVESSLLDFDSGSKEIQKTNQPQNVIDFYIGNDRARAAAMATLLNGKVPESAISEHPGSGGKIFKYVDHVWVTQLLRDAFGPFWQSEVLNAIIESDGTATATVKLTVKVPMQNMGYHEIVFTELGACNITTGMTLANRKLSAASKGLVRCAFRAFGVGQEFYKTVDYKDLTNEESWLMIHKQIKKNKKYITEDQVIQFCKDNDIAKDKITERFDDIWAFVGLTISTAKSKGK